MREPPKDLRQTHNFNPDGTPIDGLAVIETIKAQSAGDTCLLAFSGGKDSLAAWLVLRQHFTNIIPFYMYRIPNLSWVEAKIRYYEDYFETKIYRMPHENLYRMLGAHCYAPPHYWPIQEAAQLPQFEHEDIGDILKTVLDLHPDTFTATGVRAVDNIQRGMSVRKHGAINWTKRSFWPVWDMKKADLVRLLQASDVQLSDDYKWFGRSFDGMDYRFTSIISQKAPEDWTQIKRYYPLIWMEQVRYNELERPYPYE